MLFDDISACYQFRRKCDALFIGRHGGHLIPDAAVFIDLIDVKLHPCNGMIVRFVQFLHLNLTGCVIRGDGRQHRGGIQIRAVHPL